MLVSPRKDSIKETLQDLPVDLSGSDIEVLERCRRSVQSKQNFRDQMQSHYCIILSTIDTKYHCVLHESGSEKH